MWDLLDVSQPTIYSKYQAGTLVVYYTLSLLSFFSVFKTNTPMMILYDILNDEFILIFLAELFSVQVQKRY